MKLSILIVGKLKNVAYKKLTNEYIKRINHYIPMTLQIASETKKSSLSKNQVLRIEAGHIEKKLKSDYTIALDIKGDQYNSEKFAKFMQKLMISGHRRITFIIGGPLGLDERILSTADKKLSLSDLTMAHELAIVVLTEQIYRAFSINRGEKYHK